MNTYTVTVTYESGTEVIDQSAPDAVRAVELVMVLIRRKQRVSGVYKRLQAVTVSDEK